LAHLAVGDADELSDILTEVNELVSLSLLSVVVDIQRLFAASVAVWQ